MDPEPFFILAIFQASEEQLTIGIPCEYIDPVDHCEGDEIGAVGIVEFVFSTHGPGSGKTRFKSTILNLLIQQRGQRLPGGTVHGSLPKEE